MIDFFLEPYQGKSLLDIIIEIIVFFFGIISVIYAKKENILVYPTGLIATILSTPYILPTSSIKSSLIEISILLLGTDTVIFSPFLTCNFPESCYNTIINNRDTTSQN